MTIPADVLSVAQLEQSLWSAADILRGSIDSSDYKPYIFGLLFLKRLSDRFEEEAEKLVAEGLPESVDAGKKGGEFYTPRMVVRLIRPFRRQVDGDGEETSRLAGERAGRLALRRGHLRYAQYRV